MFILDQDRTTLVNIDNAVMVCRYDIPEDDSIEYVAYFNNHSVNLGKYEDTPEHIDQLERIAELMGGTNVYKMPEE